MISSMKESLERFNQWPKHVTVFFPAMVKFSERKVRKAVKSSIAETCYCHLINDKFSERKLRKV